MSKYRPSQIETLIFSFILITSTFAHGAEKCEALFKPTLTQTISSGLKALNPFKIKNEIILDSRQRTELADLLNLPEHRRPYGLGRGTENPLFMFKWRSLSETQRDIIRLLLDNAPSNNDKLRDYLSKTLRNNQMGDINGNTFFDLIVGNWFDVARNNSIKNLKFSDWLGGIENHYEEQVRKGNVRETELKLQMETGYKITQANEFWKSFLGIRNLEISEVNGQNYVHLGEHRLKVTINKSKGSAIISVPRDLIRHAAWNPLSSAVLQAKIASGERPPNIYPGFVAANGIFYLSDGNHRFELDPKPFVNIEMSYPVRTSSMSITFDAMGIRQPQPEELVSLYSNEKTLEDLIGIDLAKRIVYR